MADDQKLICVGVIASPHGVRGALKIKSFTADPADIFTFTQLQNSDGELLALTPKGQAGQFLLAVMEGVDDRNAAEQLKGTKLYIERSQLPETQEGEFYIEDLVGLAVDLADGRRVGTVKQVMNYGAGDIVEVQFNNGSEEMFSFTDDNFPEVDLTAGKVILTAPEILEAK